MTPLPDWIKQMLLDTQTPDASLHAEPAYRSKFLNRKSK